MSAFAGSFEGKVEADILRGVIGSIMKASEGMTCASRVKNRIKEHLARS